VQADLTTPADVCKKEKRRNSGAGSFGRALAALDRVCFDSYAQTVLASGSFAFILPFFTQDEMS